MTKCCFAHLYSLFFICSWLNEEGELIGGVLRALKFELQSLDVKRKLPQVHGTFDQASHSGLVSHPPCGRLEEVVFKAETHSLCVCDLKAWLPNCVATEVWMLCAACQRIIRPT